MSRVTSARSSIVVAALSSSLALLALGCGTGAEPASYLGNLRLLATRSEPAEVSSGQEVTVEALTVDGSGPVSSGVTPGVSVQWRLCTLGTAAGATSTVNPECLAASGDFLVPLGSGNRLTFTMPPVDTATLGIPDVTLGVYVPLRVTVRGPAAKTGDPERVVDGIYRLRIHDARSPLPLNKNPALAGMWLIADGADTDGGIHPTVPDGNTGIPDGGTGITPGAVELFEGQPYDMRGSDGWLLRALFADGSQESYPALSNDPMAGMMLVAKPETLTVRWYATSGNVDQSTTGVELPDSRLSVNAQMPPSDVPIHLPAPGGVIHVYAVGRDDRAGTTWVHRQLVYR